MKILMLLSNPFMVDPRVYKEAKSLVNAGHEVTVIFWDRKKEYKTDDTVEGIHVVGVNNSFFMKLIPNDLFRNPFWWWRAFKKGVKLYKNGFDFDVVHCHDLDTLFAGVLLKRKLGVKLVYDAHEIFGFMVARNMPNVLVKIVFWMEKRLLQYSDHVITVTEKVEEYLNSVCNKPITIVMNCKDLIGITYISPKTDVFTVSYIGVLHKNRMFPEIVDIIGSIKNVKFVIAGKKENLYEEVKRRCKLYDNVEFLGAIPFNEVIPRTLACDVVVCMINPIDKNNRIGLANKQFEAMVCGRPVIITEDTYAGSLTKDLRCGLTVQYNENSLRGAVETLRDNKRLCEELGKNALKAASEYNWGKQEKKLLEVYESLKQ